MTSAKRVGSTIETRIDCFNKAEANELAKFRRRLGLYRSVKVVRDPETKSWFVHLVR